MIRELLRAADWVIFGYFVALNSSYLVLMALAGLEFGRHLRRVPFAGTDDMFRSPLTLPVTLIVPAYNEGAGIVAAVQAMAALRYPRHEIVVVDDGSTDDTFERLRAQFDLIEMPRVVPSEVPYRSQVLSVHVARAKATAFVVFMAPSFERSRSFLSRPWNFFVSPLAAP